jgi:hypothetical protein
VCVLLDLVLPALQIIDQKDVDDDDDGGDCT